MFGPVAINRRDLFNGVASFTHLTLLAALWYTQDNRVKALLLAIVGTTSLWLWLAAFRRYHLIVDTPCSRVSSAAQGYVELHGRAELHADGIPIGFRSGPPCVWYRYRVDQRREGGWAPHTLGCSDETFLVNDGYGRCVIDPEGAEVHSVRRRSWQDGDYRIRIEYLAPGDPVYALGELIGLHGLRSARDRHTEISLLLRDWKRDQAMLMARFDADGDGRIDTAEWERARQAALEEIESTSSKDPQELLMMRRPSDGRPYLLSNRDPSGLVRRYRLWSWLHAGVFAGTAVAALVLLTR